MGRGIELAEYERRVLRDQGSSVGQWRDLLSHPDAGGYEKEQRDAARSRTRTPEAFLRGATQKS
jgi:hypothetical protein